MVSVIMPLFNSEKFVKESIISVLSQTWKNFELIIVDDGSTDSSVQEVKNMMSEDNRIKLFLTEGKLGAAKVRNVALKYSEGRYIAYLDSDDLWDPEKLEYQIKYMEQNNAGFSCTSYRVIDENSKELGKEIRMLEKLSYMDFLKNNLIQTVGVMVDTCVVEKKLLYMPDEKREDAATWLNILKSGHDCLGLQDIVCSYRRVSGSLSSDKIKAARGVWDLYRNVEKLSLPFSVYIFIRYAVLAVWKRSKG